MTKPIEVYIWIQERYNYYDKIENKYCGEKYTKQVFKDTSEHFKLSLNKVNELYNKSYKDMKFLNKNKEKIKIISDAINTKATKLNNKKVQINADKILKNKSRNNSKFIKFIKDNKDTIFTAITDLKSDFMYTFKEDNTWLFPEKDLIEVKE